MFYEAQAACMPSIMMGKRRNPTILVVSDEVFILPNQTLEKRCSEVLPKDGRPACITATIFDGRNESREI
jgi:hypothetical protein